MAAADPITLAGDVVTGSTALAGLMLVYVGSVVSAYSGYDTLAQEAVKVRFRIRAWLGFVGMGLAIGSAALGILGKWETSGSLETYALRLLLAALAWALVLAALTASEVS